MLVLHANWADSSLHLWAESIEGYCAESMTPDTNENNRAIHAGKTAKPGHDPANVISDNGESAISAHPFAATSDGLSRALMETGQFDVEALQRCIKLESTIKIMESITLQFYTLEIRLKQTTMNLLNH